MSNSQRIRRRLDLLPFRLPLLDQLIADEAVDFQLMAIDTSWDGYVGLNVQPGFNPLLRQIYIPIGSPVGTWCLHDLPRSRLRDLNLGDHFVSQLLFILHDYLHIWAYGTAYEIMPRHPGFMSAPISASTFDTYLYCHLLSEAVATVGVEYWWLSRVKLDKILELGTTCELLTTSYRTEHDPEYRRLHRSASGRAFESGSVEFFCDMAEFYCTGEFHGFGLRDMRRSPRLREWLSGEISYGELQRKYARQWFSFIRDAVVSDSEDPALAGAISLQEPWKRELMRTMGERLWRKIHTGDPMPTPPYPAYEFGTQYPLDLRFTNLKTEADFRRASKDEFVRKHQRKHLLGQLLSRHWRTEISVAHHHELRQLLAIDVVDAVAALVASAPRVGSRRGEPRHVFQLA